MGASAFLPLVVAGEVTGVLVLIWDGVHDASEGERAVWIALAAYSAQALARVQVTARLRSSAEILQRSLLTPLPEPNHLETRARYVPAAVGDRVGGDWYDSLILPDGATTLVIGDVVGHDIEAAAVMGQMRGALRAYAWDREELPSEIVARLDASLTGLGIERMATLIVARIEQTPAHAASGMRLLRWTNAGHPPPILLLADGSTQLLTAALADGAGAVDDRDALLGPGDLLLGLDPGTSRTDHTILLPPAATLLLYTDGLIERRGSQLDEGIGQLRRTLTRLARRPLQELLDVVVQELVGGEPDDDCALLAVRTHPENEPRPGEAGPVDVDLVSG